MTQERPSERLTDAVATGEKVRILVALRGVLAARIESAESDAAVAALARQLREVVAELETLTTVKEASIFDDLAGRRAARGRDAAPAGRKRPAAR